MERNVYIRPSVEMDLPSRKNFRLLKRLYGKLQSGLRWYILYLTTSSTKLRISRPRSDLRPLFRPDGTGLTGTIILRVGGRLIVVSETFLNDEEKGSQVFVTR